MKQNRAWILGSLLLSSSLLPANAVINCHDYTYYRLTKTDSSPVGCGRKNGLGVDKLVAHLQQEKYHPLKAYPKLDSDLKPGDVLVVGTAHSGIVNSSGFIDHWLQLFDKKGDPIIHPATKLPDHVLQNGAKGGRFQNDSLNMFISRPVGKVSLSQVRVYRKEKSGSDAWLGYWTDRNQPTNQPRQSIKIKKGKDGKLAATAFGGPVTIVTADGSSFNGFCNNDSGKYSFDLKLSGAGSATGKWTYCTKFGDSHDFPWDAVVRPE